MSKIHKSRPKSTHDTRSSCSPWLGVGRGFVFWWLLPSLYIERVAHSCEGPVAALRTRPPLVRRTHWLLDSPSRPVLKSRTHAGFTVPTVRPSGAYVLLIYRQRVRSRPATQANNASDRPTEYRISSDRIPIYRLSPTEDRPTEYRISSYISSKFFFIRCVIDRGFKEIVDRGSDDRR